MALNEYPEAASHGGPTLNPGPDVELYEIDWRTGTARKVDDEIQAKIDRLQARIDHLTHVMRRGWWEEPWLDDPEAISISTLSDPTPQVLEARTVRCTVQREILPHKYTA